MAEQERELADIDRIMLRISKLGGSVNAKVN